MDTFLEKINKDMMGLGFPARTKIARDWLKTKISSLQINRAKLVREEKHDHSTIIGNMYFFFYNAKTKKTLPYWDKFPLVFPIELNSDGFLGLNLHYLDLENRLYLLDKLYTYKNTPNLDTHTQLQLSYDLLKGISQANLVKPCIKRYLKQYVKSDFIYIHPTEWDICTMLPVENFQKATASKVWKDSMEKAGI